MKHAPRTLCLLAAASLACAAAAPAQGQTTPRKSPARARAEGQKPKPARGAKAAERQLAVAALLEAAEAARGVEHPTERVSIMADAADALWSLDESAARSLLRRAWEMTTAPDALAAFRPKEEGGRFGPRENIRSARQSVINRAARHDLKLAEGFMEEFERGIEEEEEAEVAAETPSALSRREPSEMGRRRLWAARALLEEGAYEAAAALVAPLVAEGPTVPFIEFLFALRAQSPRDADPLYLRLLGQTRADPRAGPNDVLLLSTPIISPALFVTVGADGSASLRPTDSASSRAAMPAPYSAQLRRAFFETAAGVLLRPAQPRAGEAAAPFYAISRLLPFFEREAPQHVAPLRARMVALAQELGEPQRAAVSARTQVERVTPRNPPDPLQMQLDWLARAADDAARDAARFDLASAAALKKLWDRARQYAAEVADVKTRRAAFQLIAAEQVKSLFETYRDEEAADVHETAAAFARAADAPAGMRAYGLSQAAELAVQKGRKRRAAELFAEAVGLAAQTDRGSELRVALYTALTQAASRLYPARAWELLAELASAVNEAESRPRSDEELDECPGARVETAVNSYCVELATPLPEPEESFALMARLDLARALAEARTLKGDYTRARALIAAARPPAGGAGAGRAPR